MVPSPYRPKPTENTTSLPHHTLMMSTRSSPLKSPTGDSRRKTSGRLPASLPTPRQPPHQIYPHITVIESVQEKSSNLCSKIVSRPRNATIFRARTCFSPPLLTRQSIARRPKNIFSEAQHFPSNNFRPPTSSSEMILHHPTPPMPTKFSPNLLSITLLATLRIN